MVTITDYSFKKLLSLNTEITLAVGFFSVIKTVKLVGCVWFNGSLRQYFSLSQKNIKAFSPISDKSV